MSYWILIYCVLWSPLVVSSEIGCPCRAKRPTVRAIPRKFISTYIDQKRYVWPKIKDTIGKKPLFAKESIYTNWNYPRWKEWP